ncbi:unnamed protein product [Protopolystoma xenopodis]|uniref:Uncharacterized protein n=1 Tax=Protopolystoma xenopodis TaxID=117903 RepID=A0A448WNR6_9PLAT|nr:unnamed protein product [Protopolystoma xenopodis]
MFHQLLPFRQILSASESPDELVRDTVSPLSPVITTETIPAIAWLRLINPDACSGFFSLTDRTDGTKSSGCSSVCVVNGDSVADLSTRILMACRLSMPAAKG